MCFTRSKPLNRLAETKNPSTGHTLILDSDASAHSSITETLIKNKPKRFISSLLDPHFVEVVEAKISREKCHECSVCGKKFTTLQHLNIHLRIHSGEKQFKCEICSKEFLHPSSFRSHKLLHTGERPYECTLCHMKFISSSQLKQHSRIHTGEKPYKCDECGKYFAIKSTLNAHMRTHSGETPYACTKCDKKFTQRSQLNAHKGKCHRMIVKRGTKLLPKLLPKLTNLHQK